jgi:hypothetical protein
VAFFKARTGNKSQSLLIHVHTINYTRILHQSDQLSGELIDSQSVVEQHASSLNRLNNMMDAIRKCIKNGNTLEDVRFGVRGILDGGAVLQSRSSGVEQELEKERAKTRELEVRLERKESRKEEKSGNLFNASEFCE